jgi:hypothetical protein
LLPCVLRAAHTLVRHSLIRGCRCVPLNLRRGAFELRDPMQDQYGPFVISDTPTVQQSNTPTLQHSNTPTLQHIGADPFSLPQNYHLTRLAGISTSSVSCAARCCCCAAAAIYLILKSFRIEIFCNH